MNTGNTPVNPNSSSTNPNSSTNSSTGNVPATFSVPLIGQPMPSVFTADFITNRRKEMEAEQEMLIRAENQLIEAEKARKIETIKGFPNLLGLPNGDLEGVIDLVRGVMIQNSMIVVRQSSGKSSKSNGTKTNKNKSKNRVGAAGYPDSVKENAILMRKAGDPIDQIAGRLKVSIPSLYNWFKAYGLTNKGLGGKNHRTIKGKTNKSSVHQLAPTPMSVAS